MQDLGLYAYMRHGMSITALDGYAAFEGVEPAAQGLHETCCKMLL